jgi:hypothetical protein
MILRHPHLTRPVAVHLGLLLFVSAHASSYRIRPVELTIKNQTGIEYFSNLFSRAVGAA